MASSTSFCVHLLRPCNHAPQNITFRKLTPSLIRRSFPSPTTQKYRLQFLSLQVARTTTSKSTRVCMAELFENGTSSKITPKIPATEILILVFVYIIPFLNRFSKFPVFRLLGFYQSIPTIGSIAFLALYVGFVRWNSGKLHSLQAMVMDCAVVIASLARPFLVNPDPLAGGAALVFKVQLLNVLELLGFQTCVHTCLKYLEAVPWVVWRPSIYSTLPPMLEAVLKTDGIPGRLEGKSLVEKIVREKGSILGDSNSAEACNKIILSSCQSCLDSLLDIFKEAARCHFEEGYFADITDEQLSLEVDNLLWLLDILAERQAAEEFALMWAKQQKMANLHAEFWMPSRHLVSCITARLFLGIGNVEIILPKDTRQLLLLTWFQPLVDDYFHLLKLTWFDTRVLRENIERTILELRLEDQQSIYLAWFRRFLKKGNAGPNLRKAFEGWLQKNL